MQTRTDEELLSI